MGDQLTTVVALVTAGILGGIGTWWSRRRMRSAGIGASQATIVANLRDVADSWEEKFRLEHGARADAEADVARLKGQQSIERELAAQCRSDLDDARSEIRELERQLRSRPERRQRPRPPVNPT